MQNLIAAVQDFHTEWMARPPLFTMLIAKTSPADDDQLAQVIEADARHLIDRGIAPKLARYHQYLYDVHPNQKSRAEAVHAHTMGLVEFKEYGVGKAEKEAIEELHRLDRDGIARLARMAAEKKITRTSEHREPDEPLRFTGIIHMPGGSKKSLASLRAADVSRVWIRLSMLVVLIVGILLGLLAAYLSQEKTNEAKKIVRDIWDSGFTDRVALDAERDGSVPWRDKSWKQRIEYDWLRHTNLIDDDVSLEEWKQKYPDDSASSSDDDVGFLRGFRGAEGVDLPPLREEQPRVPGGMH